MAAPRVLWRGVRWLGLALVVGGLLALIVVAALVRFTPLPAPAVPNASEIYDSKGHLVTRIFEQNRVEIPISEMPLALQQAVVAVEDPSFYSHHGIVPTAIIRALWHDLRAGGVVEGGSTLTQQLAKNLYLTQQRTVVRKVREAVLTLKLEASYSKDEILAMYLNTSFLGGSVYGVEMASQTYFGKPAKDMTLAESALIAGMLRGPSYYDPHQNLDATLKRRDFVLDRMVDQGYITPIQAATAKTEPVKLARQSPPTGVNNYFLQYVVRQLQEHDPDVARQLLSGGFRIDTTYDPEMQRAAEEALAASLPPAPANSTDVPQPEGALAAIDPRTGEILALVGGRDFARTPYDRATQARRQPGSAFKPFLYAAVLDTRRYTAASLQTSEPTDFPVGPGQPPWRPTNWEPGHPYANKAMGIREAIRVSDNIVAAKWAQAIGPHQLAVTAHNLGIDSPLREYLTLALGTSEVSPLEMARAYAPFANGGLRVEPTAILKVTDRQGRVLVDNRPQVQRVLDERVAYILTDIMGEVVRPGGTAGQVEGMIGDRPAAGKSGTTEHNSDAWFVGYTPDLVAAVWLGNDDPKVPFGMGGRDAAPVWARFVSKALSGRPFSDFQRPAGITDIDVCAPSGLLPNITCPIVHELFIAGTEPTQVDTRFYWPTLPGLPKIPLPGTPNVPELPGVPGLQPGVPGVPRLPPGFVPSLPPATHGTEAGTFTGPQLPPVHGPPWPPR